MAAVSRDLLHERIDQLSDESVKQLYLFVDYLQYREEQSKDWFLKVYELFAPVREAITASGMTGEEVDQIIDEAIEEVRRGEKA